MQIFAVGQTSPLPVPAHDGAVMTIEDAGHDILTTARFSASNLTDKEITAANTGKIEVGLVRVTSRDVTFPVFLFKFAGMVFDAPFSIGLEAEDKRERLVHALSHVGNLTRSEPWSSTREPGERTTCTTKSIRMIAPSPRCWRSAPAALRRSATLSEEVQQDMLERLFLRYPSPSQLFRRAVHVEKF